MTKQKAAALYDAIDSSRIFVGTAKAEDRSIMNVCFVMKPEYAELEKEFNDFASTKGIVGIKGHRKRWRIQGLRSIMPCRWRACKSLLMQ